MFLIFVFGIQYPGITLMMALTFMGIGYLLNRWSQRGVLTVDLLKMMFGFALLFMIIALAAVIALGNVEAKTSEGLTQVLTVISVLAGSFSQWAFGRHEELPKGKDETEEIK